MFPVQVSTTRNLQYVRILTSWNFGIAQLVTVLHEISSVCSAACPRKKRQAPADPAADPPESEVTAQAAA